MNLATLLSNQCSPVPDEVLTDKQIRSIKLDRGTARHAAQNMALGVAAVGKLLALTSGSWRRLAVPSTSWRSSNRSVLLESIGRRRLSNEGHDGYQLPGDCAG